MSLTFTYRARTPSGEPVRGTMRALDRPTALATLRERLLVPSSLEAASSTFSIGRLFSRAKPKERLAFFRAYAALEHAGVDFSTAFDLLVAQARTPRFADALRNIKSDVERGGEKLFAAMAHRPDEFTDLEVAMVAAGEEAGNREEIFDRLALFLERDERLRKRMQSALFYPAIVVVAAFCVCIYLVVAVVPQFGRLFEQFHVATGPVMGTLLAATAILDNGVVLTAAAASAALAAIVVARTLATIDGAYAFDGLRMRVPFLGEAIRRAIVARLARVIATLLESGVNQLRALDVAVPIAESPVYSRAIELARERIESGRAASLEEALAVSGVFDPLLLGFTRVGAQAGTIPAMLVKVAEYYEEDVESLLSAFPSVVQTLVTIGLGGVVAVIVYVVYVPLSSLSTAIH